MNYSPVILGYSAEYLPLFTALQPQVRAISPFWRSQTELLRFLLRAKFDPQLPVIPGVELDPQKPHCFLFFRDWYPLFSAGYLAQLKRAFQSHKACWFFSDLVSSYPNIDLERMKTEFDLILSFDPEDAQRYRLAHCPLPYSIHPQANQKPEITSDICFIGKAKQRLPLISSVRDKLSKANLRCDFHIAHSQLILPYADCLQKALSSRCILEILQDPHHHGYTARTAEALVYGKKLLSNNLRLKEAPFYDPRQIHLFSNPDEIDPDWVLNHYQPTPAPELFSPWKTLEFIEKQLQIRFLSQ